MKLNLSKIEIIFLAIVISSFCFADVKLPSIISDNMVLQQNTKVKIWGCADAKEEIRVIILNQSKNTVADKKGQWQITLEPMQHESPVEMTIIGKNKIKIKNILIGEVWLASGQSNMHWPVVMSLNGKEEVEKSDYPDIRLFYVPALTADQPAADCNARWVLCSPETTPGFPAVAYFFGRDLYNELHCPIGIIAAPYGGTFIEAWMSDESLKTTCDYSAIMERYEQDVNKYNVYLKKYQKELEQWELDAEKAKQNNQTLPTKPELPIEAIATPRNYPSRLFNAMIHPLIPYTIKGAIWYQGESNALAGRSVQYGRLFPAMLNDWRKRWGYDFSFYSVQLTAFAQNDWQPDDSNNPDWAELRDVQLTMSKLKNSGMAVTIDIGEPNNIHPLNKQDVGKRLALIALAKDYGKNVVYSGPVYESKVIKDNKIIITFSSVEDGLIAKGGKLKEFTIAANDGIFVEANAKIQGNNKVVVWNDKIKEPVAIRYGWRRCPTGCNLFNSSGLPASPFRTDNFPLISKDNK